jgi:hypothetical protein
MLGTEDGVTILPAALVAAYQTPLQSILEDLNLYRRHALHDN